MALVMLDRVQETTNTTGTGTLTLAGATSGCQTFSNIGNGNTTYYTIYSSPDWEVGIGTYTSAGNTLSRDTVLASSLGGTTKINVAAGAYVFGTYPAGRAVYTDASTNLNLPANLTFSGTGARITGDFSNATLANRVMFQTSTTNGATTLGVLPNGTSTTCTLLLSGTSDPDNSPIIRIISSDSEALIRADATGTASYVPMTFFTGGSERMRIDTSGDVGIGTNNPTYKLDIQNAGTFTGINIQNTTTSGLTNLFIQNTVNTLTYGVSPGGSYMSYTGTGPLSFSAGGSDLFVFTQAGELGIGMTPDGSSRLQIAAGSATEAPLELTAGTLMTTPDGGSIEYDGTAFYSSVANSTRGVMPSEQIFILNTTNVLTSQTAAQPIFDAGGLTNGAVTLPIGTYYYQLSFALTGMSSTSGTFGFALGGTATKTNSYQSYATKSNNALTTAVAASTAFGTGNSTALTANTTSTSGNALIRGFIRVTVAGTIIPQVSLTVAAAATIAANSHFRVSPIGNDTVTTIGNWS